MYGMYRGKTSRLAWCVTGLFAASTAYFGIRDYMRHLEVAERYDHAIVRSEKLVERAARDYELSKIKSETIILEARNEYNLMIKKNNSRDKEYNSRLREFDMMVRGWEKTQRKAEKAFRKLENVAERAGLLAEKEDIENLNALNAGIDYNGISLGNLRKSLESRMHE